MDESIKHEVTPPISETNWLNYFQNLHSDHEPLSSDQQKLLANYENEETP